MARPRSTAPAPASALSIVIGGVLGIVMAWWKPVNVLLAPIVEIFYPLPKSALIPVTVIWLGFGDGSKILLIFLGCMLPVTIGAFNGARSSEQVLVWSARSMGAHKLRMLWDVVVPSAMPELLNGIRTALALSFILLVSSELIVAQKGFGYLIGSLGANGTYDAMYAVVLTVAFLGFAADRIYLLITQAGAGMARVAPASTAMPSAGRLAARSRAAAVHRGLTRGVFRSPSLLAAWEILARSGTFTPYQLPALSAVLERIWSDAWSGDLAINTALTLYRALVSFAICAVGGVAIGMAMSRNKIANWFFDPIISVGFPMPKIAFLPVVILWLGVYDVSKITIIVIDAIFPVIAATVIAIQGVERELIWSARNMGANQPRTADPDRAAGGAAANHDRTAGRAAADADRGGGRRNADGRLRPRRRHDDGLALCQFDRRVRRHRRDRGDRLLPGQGDGAGAPPASDLAPGSQRADHGVISGRQRPPASLLARRPVFCADGEPISSSASRLTSPADWRRDSPDRSCRRNWSAPGLRSPARANRRPARLPFPWCTDP